METLTFVILIFLAGFISGYRRGSGNVARQTAKAAESFAKAFRGR